MRLPIIILVTLSGAIDQSRGSRRAEFTRRKRHIVEYRTRILLTRSYALLIRNTILSCVYKKLCRSYESDNRKDTERNREEPIAVVTGIAYGHFKLTGYVFGDLAAATTTICGKRVFIIDLYVKYDRISCFYYGARCTMTAILDLGLRAKTIITGFRLKDVNVLFSAEKNYLFIDSCNSFEFLRLIVANASLERDLNIISDVDGIESAVEPYPVNADICPGDICVLCSDIAGT